MGRKCPNCGSTEIDEDSARGDSTCMGCGTVLEESTIVSDVTFQENSGGGHSLVGQFVSKDRGQPTNLTGVPGLAHQESREVTYYKGRKLIEEIASQLRINQHCVNTAFNFFKMCVSRNFTRGRVRSHVVAACLYMTCRLENTAHLLLDFSDITQVNVFDLGRTLNFLARSLKINLPTTDPCMYILRFAVLLDFGTKQKEVVSLATRLVQRMKRDWIATGRRPTGLCGAALLLAARCYNFNRTVADVVRVVHVSEAVVRKRLDEFGQTPSSTLTIDEFTTIDLEHCEDPPAFRESRRRARELQLQKEEEALRKIESQIQPMEAEVERALEKRRKERFKRTQYARMISGSLSSESDELSPADIMVRNEIVDLVFSAAREANHLTDAGMSSTYAPSLVSLGITSVKSEVNTTDEVIFEQHNDNGELDLEGIDDDEINTYILTEEEVNLKTRFWMKLNGDHLKEMERRRREREEEEEREKDNPTKKRRRTNGLRKKEPIMAATAQEAMEKVIQEKKLSNKINYDILKEIEDSDEATIKTNAALSANVAAAVIESSEMNPGSIQVKAEQATGQTSLRLFEEEKDATSTRKRTPKSRLRFRPNVNTATKKVFEQTISAIYAAASVERPEEEEISFKKDNEHEEPSDEMEKNEKDLGLLKLLSSNDKDTKSRSAAARTETFGLGALHPKKDEAERAGFTSLNFKELSSRQRKHLKRELTAEEISGSVGASTSALGPEVAVECTPPVKPAAKTRYARMRPNLKSARTENPQDSSIGPSEIPQKAFNIQKEDSVSQRMEPNPEIPSGTMTTAEMTDTGSVSDREAQRIHETECALVEDGKPQKTRETRSRYLKVKPNLLKQSTTKTSKKS